METTQTHQIKIQVEVLLPREDGILLRFLSDPKHHPLVMGCDTPTPNYSRLSNIQQTMNPLIARPLYVRSLNCAW